MTADSARVVHYTDMAATAALRTLLVTVEQFCTPIAEQQPNPVTFRRLTETAGRARAAVNANDQAIDADLAAVFAGINQMHTGDEVDQ